MSTPQTDTPETDAAAFEVKEHGSPLSIEVTMASFAKTLERRANAAEARVKEMREAIKLAHEAIEEARTAIFYEVSNWRAVDANLPKSAVAISKLQPFLP